MNAPSGHDSENQGVLTLDAIREERQWTLTNGLSVRASFDLERNPVKKLRERVRLRSDDGKAYRVLVSKLSAPDVEFLKRISFALQKRYPALEQIDSIPIDAPPPQKKRKASKPAARRVEDPEAARAFRETLRLAKGGDVVSQVLVGRYFEEGRGVEANEREALRWFRMAAHAESLEGVFYLARCYELGIGVEPDSDKAFRGYKKTAKLGFLPAKLRLAQIYHRGELGVRRNRNKATHWYFAAAVDGDPVAQTEMARRCERGSGIEQDEQAACQWLRKAAGKKHGPALVALGDYYAQGRAGLDEDPEAAYEYYRQAAFVGDADGQDRLGDCLRRGYGCFEDPREAFEQYRKAAAQHLPQAQTHVGVCFEEGIGRPQDPYQAFYWYRKAAKNKDPEGMRRLGRAYFLGAGVARDERKAVKWFRRSADAGLSSAQVLMGKSLLSGSGTAVDRPGAFRYFKRAAVKGDPDGVYNLALCYEHGLGAPKDHDRAMELYRHAARLGSSEAARRLE